MIQTDQLCDRQVCWPVSFLQARNFLLGKKKQRRRINCKVVRESGHERAGLKSPLKLERHQCQCHHPWLFLTRPVELFLAASKSGLPLGLRVVRRRRAMFYTPPKAEVSKPM